MASRAPKGAAVNSATATRLSASHQGQASRLGGQAATTRQVASRSLLTMRVSKLSNSSDLVPHKELAELDKELADSDRVYRAAEADAGSLRLG